MGTRGLTGIRQGERDLLTYFQFDGYPEVKGVQALDFARELTDTEIRDKVTKAAEAAVIVDEREDPTTEQVKTLRAQGITPQQVSTGSDWYAWLRDYQGDFMGCLFTGFIPANNDFINDSLFCEWAYVVNLDEDVLEVYRGFQEEQGTGRYAEAATEPDGKYWPCSLVITFPLDALPASDDEFVKAVYEAVGEEE